MNATRRTVAFAGLAIVALVLVGLALVFGLRTTDYTVVGKDVQRTSPTETSVCIRYALNGKTEQTCRTVTMGADGRAEPGPKLDAVNACLGNAVLDKPLPDPCKNW